VLIAGAGFIGWSSYRFLHCRLSIESVSAHENDGTVHEETILICLLGIFSMVFLRPIIANDA